MEGIFCQSCAMPMGKTDEMRGTNADGSKSEDYCIYCFENGAFLQDFTMDEMIEFCVPHMVSGNPGMSESEARKMMREYFPTLKRWKAAL
ncbi:MAG: zinc ribbon domain-containing protein [Holophagales bacterium]|jgi:hypothetical protein|nr:zinc ribbon domain-containing protein [Holophagales bacterium]